VRTTERTCEDAEEPETAVLLWRDEVGVHERGRLDETIDYRGVRYANQQLRKREVTMSIEIVAQGLSFPEGPVVMPMDP